MLGKKDTQQEANKNVLIFADVKNIKKHEQSHIITQPSLAPTDRKIPKTSHLVEDEENEVGQQRLDGQVGGSIVDAEDGRQDDVGVVPDALPLK